MRNEPQNDRESVRVGDVLVDLLKFAQEKHLKIRQTLWVYKNIVRQISVPERNVICGVGEKPISIEVHKI